VNAKSNAIDFSQYVIVPFVGSAWINREEARPNWLPFFSAETQLQDDSCDEAGNVVKGIGQLNSITLRAGRWLLVLDRPHVGNSDHRSTPLMWNLPVWLVIAAPVVAVMAIAASLSSGLFKHFIAKPLGWLAEPVGILPEA
jgi:hypothetical protein